jgi:hypothetical protein
VRGGEDVASLLQFRRVWNVISGHGHRLEKGSDDAGVEPVGCLRALCCFVARERPVSCEAKADGSDFDSFGCVSSAGFGVFVVGGVIDFLGIVAIFLESLSHSEASKVFVWGVY